MSIMKANIAGIKALAFDVFGTIVDYRTTIIREGALFNIAHELDIDWGSFADEWRGRYRPNMDRVLSGELPWMNLDALHRMALEELLPRYGLDRLSEGKKDHLNRVWHRLEPWGDCIPGLQRLKSRYIITPLSNGNVSLLANMAKHTGLPWDLILTPELIQKYKPDPRAYQMVMQYLGLQADEVMMVAAHQFDLQAAKEQGMRTAYILRPLEYGIGAVPDLTPQYEYDVIAADIMDLARQLD